MFYIKLTDVKTPWRWSKKTEAFRNFDGLYVQIYIFNS